MNSKKLKFGIMMNSAFILQEWQRQSVELILSSGLAECALLIIDVKTIPKRSFIKKFFDFISNKPLYHFYIRFFCSTKSRVNKDCTDLLCIIPQIHCSTIRKGKISEYFEQSDIETIKNHRLDFILRFGFNIIRGEILNIPKYGVWSFHHGDEKKYRGGPTGFWEIFRNENINGAILQRLTNRIDAGIILKRGSFKTISHSYPSHVDQLLFSSVDWPLKVCRDILNNVTHYFNADPSLTEAKINLVPRNTAMIRFLIKQLCRRIFFHLNDLFFEEHWNVGIINVSIAEFLENPSEINDIKWMSLGSRRYFHADPFIYEREGKVNIIYETYDYKKCKGILNHAFYSKEKGFSNSQIFLEELHHLSFPYIFSYNDNLFCIPEKCAIGKVDLYRIDSNENKIYKVRNLLNNIKAVDTCLFYYNHLFWLFCTHQDHDSNTHLYAYYSQSLEDKFLAHSNNPIKSDITSSRPAGNIFRYGEYVCRPVQDCSVRYGGSVKINKIINLSPLEFQEEELFTIMPFVQSPYKKGLHTLNHSGQYVVIDSKSMCFVWDSFIHKLRFKIRNLFSNKLKNK